MKMVDGDKETKAEWNRSESWNTEMSNGENDADTSPVIFLRTINW